jgi:hypothetical protein
MAKSIQEITFDAVEAFWRSAMDDLGVPMDESGYYCCTAAGYMRRDELDFKVDFFEELAATLIRALAVEQARIDGDTESRQ